MTVLRWCLEADQLGGLVSVLVVECIECIDVIYVL